MSIDRRNYNKIIAVAFIRFFGDALFYAFLTRYFSTLGFSTIQVGILIGVIPGMAILGNIVLSKVATNLKINRVIFIFWILIEGTFISLSGFITSFWWVLMFDCICCFCSNSFYNLFDTFIIYISNKVDKSYSSIRVFGTIAYIVSTFVVGILISLIGYKHVFLIGGALLLISGIVFLFVRFDKDDFNISEKDSKTEPVKLKDIFKNKNYILYFSSIIIILGIHWSSDNIYNLYTSYLNIPDATFGYFTSGSMIVEAITLIVASKFRKFKYLKKMFIISASCLVVRLSIFAIPGLNNYIYLSAQLLRGVTYGLLISANLYLLSNIVKKKFVNKCFFIAVAANEAFSAIINLSSTTIISLTSYTFIFVVLAAIASTSIILVSLIKPMDFIDNIKIERPVD